METGKKLIRLGYSKFEKNKSLRGRAQKPTRRNE